MRELRRTLGSGARDGGGAASRLRARLPTRPSFFVAALPLLVLASLTGCAGAPLAETPSKLPDARALGADAETYALDAHAVSLEADVHAMADHTLRFGTIKGTLGITPSDVLASNVDVTVETSSASATLGVVADVAKSGSFLDVSAFPIAHFVSRTFEKKANAPAGQIELIGELELHGVKRAIRVPAALAVDGCEVRFSTEFAINRRQYKVESDNSLDGVVGDGVTLRIRADVPRKNRPASCDKNAPSKAASSPTSSPKAPSKSGAITQDHPG